jgi:molybdopterin molybdotransferase
MGERLRLIPAEEARRLLLETAPVGLETVPLAEASGRVLVEALAAPHHLPSERRSAMDGYALRADDLRSVPVALKVAGRITAGGIFGRTVPAGEAVAISTGSVVPAGADAVVMVEDTTPLDGSTAVEIKRQVPPGANVVQPGEDLRAGVPVLSAGWRLRPTDLAALAVFGVVRVPVFRRPRIAVLTTGSEICEANALPRPGQVRDVNEYVLGAQVEAAGGVPVRAGIVPDDLVRLRAVLRELVDAHDGVVLSGGSSVGSKDFTGDLLRELPPPGLLFHGIDIRPGKPTVFGRAGAKPVVGMPGFPTSAMVVFEAFIRPLVARLGGETIADPWSAPVRARLVKPYNKPPGREDYLRVRLSLRDGESWADVLPGGSAAISNIIFADGLARIPTGIDHLDAGSRVAVRLL